MPYNTGIRRSGQSMGRHAYRRGVHFQTLCVEVLGVMEGMATIKRLAISLARAGGLEEGETSRHLFQRLSILLMRGNSQLILARRPSHPDTATSGDL